MICTRWRRRNAIPSTWPDRRMASRTQAAPLQRKHGLGAWQVSGMFYGRPTPRLSRRSSACGRISSAAARPATSAMKRRWAWRRCAWRSIPWTAAPAPTNGHAAVAARQRQLMVPARHAHGGQTGAGARSSRARHFRQARDGLHRHARRVRAIRAGLHVLVWNKDDKNENARADACYRELAETFARHGVGVGRAPADYHDLHMRQMIPELRDACAAIKKALDPNGVISPGKYGIPTEK